MTNGYAGKILRINLTDRTTSAMDTEPYEEYGGGYGMGAAVFWDLCEDKTVESFDPKNVITVMTSPLTGTIAPCVAGRIEMTGISPYCYPEWYSRSNMGGFVGPMLKLAGWDGIAIEGKADSPVWVKIIDGEVTIEDADGMWGMDTYATQEEVWRQVTGRNNFGEWIKVTNGDTTQGPATMCIGPAGETLSRLATVSHGCGMAFGQGGFGAVWGAKNLKAIGVVGTGSVKIADVNALIDARNEFTGFACRPNGGTTIPANAPFRASGCMACPFPCKYRSQTGIGNDSICAEAYAGGAANSIGVNTATDFLGMYGLNAYEGAWTSYLFSLYMLGVAGPGKEIDTNPLPMDKYGTTIFTEALARAISTRDGIGKYLAEGDMRMAEAFGRMEEDLQSGLLFKPQWGYNWHWTTPEISFAYGSLFGTRDTNEHCWQGNFRLVNYTITPEKLPAAKLVENMSKATIPYTDDPLMFNYGWQGSDGSDMAEALETGIYSEHKAKFIAWHRYYTRYYKESIGYCDFVYPMFAAPNTPDYSGWTPEYEPKFINAITGNNMTFEDGIKAGRKIWNLNRAIFILQGRHRDMEKFAEFMYAPSDKIPSYITAVMGPLSVIRDGEWIYEDCATMFMDRDGVETFKDRYYAFEGWDVATGWPTRSTLEELGLNNVADTLEAAGKLGNPS